jgi:Zn-dependent membrane protease YugP
MMMFYDPVFLMFMIPGLILSLIASIATKSTFMKYSKVPASSGMTGAQAAEAMLSSAGVYDVAIEPVGGFLSDHYDPSSKTLRLSDNVYASRSLSAIGVACHEAGHALQHAEGYAPLGLRSALVPATNFASNFSYWIILLGFIFHSQQLVLAGAILFGAAVVFAIITLPVEWNASARAKKLMITSGIVSEGEGVMAGKVLNAAFMTYLAAAVSALLTLIYYLMRAGILGGGDD